MSIRLKKTKSIWSFMLVLALILNLFSGSVIYADESKAQVGAESIELIEDVAAEEAISEDSSDIENEEQTEDKAEQDSEEGKESTEEPVETELIKIDEDLIILNDTDEIDEEDQSATESENVLTAKDQLDINLAYLVETIDNPTFGIGGGEWVILSLARSNYAVHEDYYDIYYKNVESEVAILMEEYSGKLDRNKGTEHSRLILGLTAIGKKIDDVAGYDVKEALADFNFLTRQGINGPIFGLIALDTIGYEMPVIEGVENPSTKEKMIDYILDKEIKKDTDEAGGWSLGGGTADPDITGMAIQGLTPYYETNSEVKAAVNRAIAWLSENQRIEDGGYESWGAINLESTAQVIVALSGLNIDPHTDERFIKNGRSAIDALLDFGFAEGGFSHSVDGQVNGMATEQGTYALVAYDRFVNGANRFYDMTDVKFEDSDEIDTSGPTIMVQDLKDGQEVTKEKVQFTVRATDHDDQDITPIVKLNGEVLTGTDGSYYAVLTIGENTITVEAADATGNKSDVTYTLTYQRASGGGSGGSNSSKKQITLSIHKQTINKGYVLSPTKVDFNTGDSAWDVVKREMDQRGISYQHEFSGKYNSVYVQMIAGDGEFDHGSGSGWMYNVNGWYPNYGASQYTLKDGESVQWRYTKNLGEDLGEDLSQWQGEDDSTAGGSAGGGGSAIAVKPGEKNPVIEIAADTAEDHTVNITKDLLGTENITIRIPEENKNKVSINLKEVKDNIPQITIQSEDKVFVIAKGTKLISGNHQVEVFTPLKEDSDVEALVNEHLEDKKGNVEHAFSMGNSAGTVTFDQPVTMTLKRMKGLHVGFIEQDEMTPISIYESDEEGSRKTKGQSKQTYAFIQGADLVIKTNHFTSFVLYSQDNASDEVIEEEKPIAEWKLENIYQDVNLIADWAYESIKEATQKELVGGYDQKIHPKKNVTRAEFTNMLVSVLNLETVNDQVTTFTDVKQSDWFSSPINTAFKEGIVSGYENNQFRPNQTINREEMASMIHGALKLTNNGTSTNIKDFNHVSAWAQSTVKAIVSSQLMVGYEDHSFKPKAHATREMAIVVALKASKYTKGEQPEAKPEPVEPQPDRAVIEKAQQQIKKTATYMQQTNTSPIVGSIGGEWTVLSLARSGEHVPSDYYDRYYANLTNTLQEKSGVLHRVKYTEYDRVILALTALGRDITDVAGYDMREPLADFNTLTVQGINGPIFALIALDSNNYDVPLVEGVQVQTTRDLLVDFILKREVNGGGWALGENPSKADPDITGMAIQGLTPYYDTNPLVKAAVDRGLTWLSQVQQADGGYESWGSVNSESTAQVIVALTGLGIDPHTDSRFIKNGHSAVDSLLSFSEQSGGFYHIKSGEQGNGGALPGVVDPMATDQAMYALVAYERFVNNKNRLYDLTDVAK